VALVFSVLVIPMFPMPIWHARDPIEPWTTFILVDLAASHWALLTESSVYRAPRDSSITPAEAGHALERIVGPSTRVAAAPERRRDLLIFARAPQADIVGTRHSPATVDGFLTPLLHQPDYAELSLAFQDLHREGLAAQQRGDLRTAERRLREAISAGNLLARESVTTLDAFRGAGYVRTAMVELGELYRSTGRVEDAHRIETALERSRRTRSQPAGVIPADVPEATRRIRHLVQRRDLPLAVRWEIYLRTLPLIVCAGPDATDMSQVKTSLIRRESDATLIAHLERKTACGL
jgi:hypothetical protein